MQTQGPERPLNAPLPHRTPHPQSGPPPLQVIIQTRSIMPLNSQQTPLEPQQIPLTQASNLPDLQLDGHLPLQTTKIQVGH